VEYRQNACATKKASGLATTSSRDLSYKGT
jgi:hypothetical protein